MKEQFVTYEIALKLKELGFDEECFGRYEGADYYLEKWNEVKLEPTHTTSQNTFSWQLASAPLWQQVIDWIREKYGIHIELDFGLGWGYGFIPVGTELTYNWNHFEDDHKWSYYEAREQAILKVIELCQKEK